MRPRYRHPWQVWAVRAGLSLSVACLLIAGNGSVGAAAPATSASTSLSWHSVPVQAPPNGLVPSGGLPLTDLLSTGNVSCLSTTDCVVAGYIEDQASYPQLYHAVIWQWGGHGWDTDATGVSGYSALVGTACPSATSCWAVGGLMKGKALDQAEGLIDHFDGKHWSPVAIPVAAGVSLNGVACSSPSQCVAVGNQQTSKDAAHAEAFVWDGKAWKNMTIPSPPGAQWTVTDSVVCFTATNCLAVGDARNSLDGTGYFFGEHFNGMSWSLLSMPNPEKFDLGNESFLSLACSSTISCLAAGSAWGYTKGQEGMDDLFGVSYKWDGKSWTTVTWPSHTCFGQCSIGSPTGSKNGYKTFYYAAAAACVSSSCWVALNLDPLVGDGNPGQGPLDDPLALAQWEGSSFALVQGTPLGAVDAIGCLPVAQGTWCVGLGEAPADWTGKGTSRQPAKQALAGGYFVAQP